MICTATQLPTSPVDAAADRMATAARVLLICLSWPRGRAEQTKRAHDELAAAVDAYNDLAATSKGGVN